MATHSKTGLERTASALRYFERGANKSRLTNKEKRRLSNIKASIRNANEDGYIGGESGISPDHFARSAEWLEHLISAKGLVLPSFGDGGWPVPESR